MIIIYIHNMIKILLACLILIIFSGVSTLCSIYHNDYAIKKFLMRREFIKNHLLETQYRKADKYADIVSNHVDKGGKILDFGTATGCMSKVLKDKYGYTVYPLD